MQYASATAHRKVADQVTVYATVVAGRTECSSSISTGAWRVVQLDGRAAV